MKPRETVRAGAESGRPKVRPARIDDADALAQLATQLGYPSSREQVERRLGALLGEPGHVVLLAEAEPAGARVPQIAGWIHAYVKGTIESDPAVELGGLVVDEAWRGRGVGRLLMGYAERWARRIGCAAVTARSNVMRESAHAFYRKLGYNVVKSQHVFRKSVAP
jgi:GNAT superfamily N-acetyltransferase